MTPIEDHLNAYTSTVLSAYLAQFNDEQEVAFSWRCGAYLDRQLARSGIVSGDPIELPANIPPKLLNNRLTEGDDSMNNQSNPTRVRIYSHMTQSRFLHIEDTLEIGKVRLFGGNYRKGEGMTAYAHAFVDIDDARVIFGALARGEQDFRHKEYKGTPQNGGTAVSRVLSIAIKGENVYIELKSGPGKLTSTGAITPNGPAKVEVNIGFKLYEARRMAASVLAYIQAWDVMRMRVNQHLVSLPTPYLLVSATSESNGVKAEPTNSTPKQNGVVKTPVVVANSDRPVTRKTNQPAAITQPSPPANSLPPRRRGGRSQNGHTAQNGRNSQPSVLLYGDGTQVSTDNQTECSVYARYRQAKSAVPPSKHALQQFYQQQMAA